MYNFNKSRQSDLPWEQITCALCRNIIHKWAMFIFHSCAKLPEGDLFNCGIVPAVNLSPIHGQPQLPSKTQARFSLIFSANNSISVGKNTCPTGNQGYHILLFTVRTERPQQKMWNKPRRELSVNPYFHLQGGLPNDS